MVKRSSLKGMSTKKSFYLTTTLPYVNDDPHIGFVLEIIQADIQARYHALQGEEVFFNTGTDEHGLKIYRKALEAKKDPQTYADIYAEKFKDLKSILNLYPALHFIRTTDARHIAAAQEFWRRCLASGDIYKKNYRIKYCVSCELEKSESELIHGHCSIHPNIELELIDEENYFFRFSRYQSALTQLYTEHADFVIPASRFNEIKKFVQQGLEDFSISRVKEKMPWGIAIPDDDEQIMYVWFDALINYVSTLGWPVEEKKFQQFWGNKEGPQGIQMAGKDQIRQQAAIWQAMLLSAGLPTSKQIVIHGFITLEGQKMSKSVGNVVSPYPLVKEYGTDALRYYLSRHVSPFEDSDFGMEKFKEAYNANLANGLGNLVARIMQLAQTHLPKGTHPEVSGFPQEYTEALKKFEINRAADYIWSRIQLLDQKITDTKPFKVIEVNSEAGKKIIFDLTQELYFIGRMLNPFMPGTSEKIKKAVIENKKPETLFPRKI